MLIEIPKGCKITYGAYEMKKSGDIGKLISHNDSLKTLIKEYPDHIYGMAIVKK